MSRHLPDGRPFLDAWSGNESEWRRLSSLFLEAERIARSFVVPKVWVPIHLVRLAQKDNWLDSGEINVAVSEGKWGVLFHEVFHSAFHRSPLHAGGDEQWSNGFCDAFRYFLEEAHLPNPPSGWLLKLRRYLGLQPDEILVQSHDCEHDREYALPASLIVRRARCIDSFKLLWHKLCARRVQSQQDVCQQQFQFQIDSP